jgi:hypothetical protein
LLDLELLHGTDLPTILVRVFDQDVRTVRFAHRPMAALFETKILMLDPTVPTYVSVLVNVLILVVPSDALTDVLRPEILLHRFRERFARSIIEVGNVSDLSVRRKNRVDIEALIDEAVGGATAPCFFHFDFVSVVCPTLSRVQPIRAWALVPIIIAAGIANRDVFIYLFYLLN